MIKVEMNFHRAYSATNKNGKEYFMFMNDDNKLGYFTFKNVYEAFLRGDIKESDLYINNRGFVVSRIYLKKEED